MNNIAVKSTGDPLGNKSEEVRKRSWTASMAGLLRGPGPYLVLLLILPGGMLIAPLLWLHRHRHKRAEMMLRS